MTVFHWRMNRQPNHDHLQRNTDFERFFFVSAKRKAIQILVCRLQYLIRLEIIIMEKFHPVLWSTLIAMCALTYQASHFV